MSFTYKSILNQSGLAVNINDLIVSGSTNAGFLHVDHTSGLIDAVTPDPTQFSMVGDILTIISFGTGITTDELKEGKTNLYYTDARFDTRFATKTTSDLTEGTNLYYTDARFDTRFALKTTDNLTEGSTNKYFSNTLARGAISAGTGISYNSGTGVISASGVTSITGTANQVIASASTGAITLSTPQDIGTSSSPTFTALTTPLLGPTTAVGLALRTNNVSRVTIDSAGKTTLLGTTEMQANATVGYISGSSGGVYLTNTASYGKPSVQSATSGFAPDDLWLNPQGGNVIIRNNTYPITLGASYPASGTYLLNNGSHTIIGTRTGSMFYGLEGSSGLQHHFYSQTTLLGYWTPGNLTISTPIYQDNFQPHYWRGSTGLYDSTHGTAIYKYSDNTQYYDVQENVAQYFRCNGGTFCFGVSVGECVSYRPFNCQSTLVVTGATTLSSTAKISGYTTIGGTTTPVAPLCVSPGVFGPATSYANYKLLGYDAGTAATSYGVGVDSNTLWFNSNQYHKFYNGSTLLTTIDANGIYTPHQILLDNNKALQFRNSSGTNDSKIFKYSDNNMYYDSTTASSNHIFRLNSTFTVSLTLSATSAAVAGSLSVAGATTLSSTLAVSGTSISTGISYGLTCGAEMASTRENVSIACTYNTKTYLTSGNCIWNFSNHAYGGCSVSVAGGTAGEITVPIAGVYRVTFNSRMSNGSSVTGIYMHYLFGGATVNVQMGQIWGGEHNFSFTNIAKIQAGSIIYFSVTQLDNIGVGTTTLFWIPNVVVQLMGSY